MKIIIVGGGKLGYHLARNMLDKKYEVHLIEMNKMKCMNLANELDIGIVCGDGTEIETLASADTQDADCFIAVTGSDQDNLVAMQLARRHFNAKKLIARANDPRNTETLRELGQGITVNSTQTITALIEQEVNFAEMHLLASLNKGKANITEFTVPKGSPLEDMALKHLPLPKGSLVISVQRGDKLIVPNGDTVFREGDEIVVLCDENGQKQFQKFVQKKR